MEEKTEELEREPRTYTFTVSRLMAIVGAVVVALVIAGASFAIGRSTAGDDHGGPPGGPGVAFGQQGFGGGQEMPQGSSGGYGPPGSGVMPPTGEMPGGGAPPGELPTPGGSGSSGGSGGSGGSGSSGGSSSSG